MRREPYKISSGLLTLAVHVLFFGGLYLGVSWHSAQPEGMQVELWGQLPEAQPIPPHAAPPPPTPPKVEPVKPAESAKPAAPPKAAIQLPEKARKTEEKKPTEAAKPPPKPKKMTKAQQKQAMEDMQALEQQQDMDLAARQEQAALAAKAAAAIASEQQKYMGLISARIRSHIVMPPDLTEKVEARFVITLLPDGSLVNDPRMTRSSGNAAYDAAVLRAILKSQPFPLPEDQATRIRFINPNQIKLKFNSKDEQ